MKRSLDKDTIPKILSHENQVVHDEASFFLITMGEEVGGWLSRGGFGELKKIFYSLWLFIIEKGCFREKKRERVSKYNTYYFDGKGYQRKVWLELSYSP